MMRKRVLAMDFDGTLFCANPKPGVIAPIVRSALEGIAPVTATAAACTKSARNTPSSMNLVADNVVAAAASSSDADPGVTRVVVTGRNLRSLFKAFDSSVVDVSQVMNTVTASPKAPTMSSAHYGDDQLELCSHHHDAKEGGEENHNDNSAKRSLLVWRQKIRQSSAVSSPTGRSPSSSLGSVNGHAVLEGGRHYKPSENVVSDALSHSNSSEDLDADAPLLLSTRTAAEDWNRQRCEWLPVDYVIAGSGACLINWRTLEIVESRALSAPVAKKIAKILVDHGISFFLLEGPPSSHRSHIHVGLDKGLTGDFHLRQELYNDCSMPFDMETTFSSCASCGADGSEHEEELLGRTFSQFVLIRSAPTPAGATLTSDEIARREQLEEAFTKVIAEVDSDPNIRMVTMTSPGDGRSQWIEILPCHVSKSDSLVALAADIVANGQKQDEEYIKEMLISDDELPHATGDICEIGEQVSSAEGEDVGRKTDFPSAPPVSKPRLEHRNSGAKSATSCGTLIDEAKLVEVVAVGNDLNDLDLLSGAAMVPAGEKAPGLYQKKSLLSQASKKVRTAEERRLLPYSKDPTSPSGEGSMVHAALNFDTADVIIEPCGGYLVGDATKAICSHQQAARFTRVSRSCREGAVAEVIEHAFDYHVQPDYDLGLAGIGC